MIRGIEVTNRDPLGPGRTETVRIAFYGEIPLEKLDLAQLKAQFPGVPIGVNLVDPVPTHMLGNPGQLPPKPYTKDREG